MVVLPGLGSLARSDGKHNNHRRVGSRPILARIAIDFNLVRIVFVFQIKHYVRLYKSRDKTVRN